MSGITTGGVEIHRELAATPAEVFAAWTLPRNFAQWFGGRDVRVPLDQLDFVAEAGRAWHARMVLPDGTMIDWAGDFLEVTLNERIVLNITDRPSEQGRAKIVVELAATSDGTLMHFTQETPGFTPDQQQAVLTGWQAFMDELARVASE